MHLKTRDFHYNLPLELIAQTAHEPRDEARLLVLNKKNKKIEHRIFKEIIAYLRPGDLLVLNNSKVFPARLIGKKEKTGGQVEVFLHQQKESDIWECLVGGRVKKETTIIFSKKLQGVIIKNNYNGTWLVKFNLKDKNFFKEINKYGHIPLPPYIKRLKKVKSDKINYQTVFADEKKVGSVAAPTAGLHFTKSLLKKIKAQGVKIEFITLHVGLGTFSSVKTALVEEHKMHQEYIEISSKTITTLKEVKKNKGRVFAVGTTCCRALEAAERDYKILNSDNNNFTFWTDIFIYPPYQFKVVDALITNFHLPESTLLMLVSAFVDQKTILKTYQLAVKDHYRFFSYGDAMLIV